LAPGTTPDQFAKHEGPPDDVSSYVLSQEGATMTAINLLNALQQTIAGPGDEAQG